MAPNFTYPDFSLIRHGFPTTLAKGVRIIEGPLYYGQIGKFSASHGILIGCDYGYDVTSGVLQL